MAALFDGSTSFLTTSSLPFIGPPYTVGCWCQFSATGGAAELFAQSNSGSTTQYWLIGKDTSDRINFQTAGSAGTLFLAGAVVYPVNTWVFVIARLISATNRRVDVLAIDGGIEHLQQTSNQVFTGLNTQTIGALTRSSGTVSFWPGLIAEIWGYGGDVQPGGAAMDDNLLRQFAFHGPLSVPSLLPALSFYDSMRSAHPARRSPVEDYALGAPLPWASTGVIVPGRDHPPLPYEYDRPTPVARMLMI